MKQRTCMKTEYMILAYVNTAYMKRAIQKQLI